MVAFYILFFIVVGLKFLEIYTRDSKVWLSKISIGLDVASLIFHFLLVCSNPGRLNAKKKKIEFIKLLEAFDSSILCPECEVIRTSRSRHCIVCH